MRQKDNESTEGIFERLDPASLNMNLVSGNMHSGELQDKKKVVNPSRSDEDTAVTLKDSLMGTPLFKSASDKKYGYLKRSLINSMTQRHNRFMIDFKKHIEQLRIIFGRLHAAGLKLNSTKFILGLKIFLTYTML